MSIALYLPLAGAGTKDWALNVKNTFINFDPTAAPAARRGRCPQTPLRAACNGRMWLRSIISNKFLSVAETPYPKPFEATSPTL